MKYTELKTDIQNGARQIYLLEGDDAYIRIKGEEALKSAFVQMPELNYTAFDGEGLKGAALSKLVSAISSVPFMSEKRMVKVSEFYPSESDYEKYLKYAFENFPSTTVLLIVNRERGKGADLKRKHSVAYFDCNKADEETVAKWAYLTFKKAGISASAEACANIARYCLSDMARVSAEVEKLIDYKVSGNIEKEDVDELVFKDSDYRIYEMTNAVSRRDLDKFVKIESELCLKAGDELQILSGLFSYFKNLTFILLSDTSIEEKAKLLRMKEYGVKKSKEQAQAIGEENLKKYVAATYGAIADIKSGARPPKTALQAVNNLLFFN